MKHEHLMSTLDFRQACFVRGTGDRLISRDGGDYIDFFADVGTASLGYAGEEQRKVLQRMLDGNIPVHAPNLYGFGERDRAAERLTRLTKMDKVFFCNSGTEAVEASIKLARKFQWDRGYQKRIAIYSYSGGFHGRTYGGLAAGDGPPHHYHGFGPLPPDFYHFEQLDQISTSAAAVILAPIFGNNDVRLYPDGWLQELRKLTADRGIILIFDEVQTGSGRCGHFTYAQRIGVDPDVITLAKGIGMGCPVGAMLAKAEVAEAFTPGSHFSTFGGNPLSCAFVNGMLDYLEGPLTLSTISSSGEAIRENLREMLWPQNVRGDGMLNAFDTDVDSLEFSLKCLEEGLLIGAFRPGPGTVKITPPLNIGGAAFDQGLRIMDKVYRAMKS